MEAKYRLSLSSGILIRKQFVFEAGLFDESIVKYGEDCDMWFRIALRYPAIGYTQAITWIYWMRPGSITAKAESTPYKFFSRIRKTESHVAGFGNEIKSQAECLVPALP